MNRLPIQVLVLSVIAISNVIAYKGYDDDFVDFNRKTDMCVNKAKDQELCDEFLHCKTKLPKPYLNCLSEKSSLDEDGKKQYEVYKQCLHKVCDKCMKNN
ncbi:hypothetical protein TNCT_103972 [Trichonephila clavata]|uniref:Uncharacterized protein n=1 Tax=Trichonephila clavata TaxID=2740835 RepID=A0A8X6FJN3_TRICU|nr:hypothetical protein TNCT_103972 [Trichonephila clavata]